MRPVRASLISASASVRYIVAFAACVLSWFAAHVIHGVPSPYVPALAAMIFSAAWAGPGPGLAASALSATWIGVDRLAAGGSLESTLAGGAIFIAEGALLSLGSARMLRFARDAASSEGRYRQLFEGSSEGIWIQDLDGAISWANSRVAEMLGIPADRLLGRTVEDFYFPADISMERVRVESLASGPRQQFDRRLRRSDGSELWVLACSSSIESGDVLSHSVLTMMTDINERKRAEQALRRSEQRYRQLFDAVVEGICQTSADGRITAANSTLLRMLGYAHESELRGQSLVSLGIAPAERRKFIEQLEREGVVRNAEHELRCASGDSIHVRENARALRDEAGIITGFEVTVTDVTAKKRVERQQRESQKIEALGRLAAGIARDFSSVLGLITAHLDATLASLGSEDAAHHPASRAREAARSAEALTRQLLTFSRRPGESDSTAESQPESESPSRHETILLVEHDPLIRELSRDMLERQGYNVVLASEATEAESIGGAAHFDLLITDLRMGAMTGEELTRRLRAVHPGLRALFVSGYDDPPRDETELTLPNTGLISRPFSAESLGRRIGQILAETGNAGYTK